METLFVVSAGIHYDGATPIHAFQTKVEAEEFAATCSQYDAERPIFDPDATQEEMANWLVSDEARRLLHPGGGNAFGADYYVVNEVPFISRPSPPREKQ